MAKRIESKIMKEYLKKGWTTEDFCMYLGLEAVDFNEALENSFHERILRDMKSQLTKNDKARSKLLKARSAKVDNHIDISALAMPVIPEVEPVTVKVAVEEKAEKTLEDYVKEASSLKEHIASIEANFQAMFSKRRDIYLSLADEKKALEEILKSISEREEIISGLCTNLSQVEENLLSCKNELSSRQKELDEVENKIKELTTVSVFFYSDGSFEFDGKKNETTIEDEKIKEMVNAFLGMEAFEELTIKQIKGLARLKAILETLDSKYQITFESESLEKAFNSIIS